jgi:hypothetical protein
MAKAATAVSRALVVRIEESSTPLAPKTPISTTKKANASSRSCTILGTRPRARPSKIRIMTTWTPPRARKNAAAR